jgi:hypothetical protein
MYSAAALRKLAREYPDDAERLLRSILRAKTQLDEHLQAHVYGGQRKGKDKKASPPSQFLNRCSFYLLLFKRNDSIM